MAYHIYGMRLRGFSPGCQPMDGLRQQIDGKCGYHDLLLYDRTLTDDELRQYELDDLTNLPNPPKEM